MFFQENGHLVQIVLQVFTSVRFFASNTWQVYFFGICVSFFSVEAQGIEIYAENKQKGRSC